MSLIKKSNELVIPSTVKMMIYGQAGMGKTTVALSAPKPLLLDFDNGVKRVNMAHLDGIDIVQVSSGHHRKDDGFHHFLQMRYTPAANQGLGRYQR